MKKGYVENLQNSSFTKPKQLVGFAKFSVLVFCLRQVGPGFHSHISETVDLYTVVVLNPLPSAPAVDHLTSIASQLFVLMPGFHGSSDGTFPVLKGAGKGLILGVLVVDVNIVVSGLVRHLPANTMVTTATNPIDMICSTWV